MFSGKQIFWMVALAFSLAQSFGATVTASLERDTVAVGDTTRLNIRIEGGNPQAVPDVPSLPNVTIEFSGQSSQYTVINGRASTSLMLTYFVTPNLAGTYTIPSARVTVDGVTHATQPLRLVATSANNSAGGTPAAFVRLNASKTNVYVGELIPIEIKAYGLIDELNFPTLKSDGFTIAGQGQALRGHEQFGNEMLNVFTFPMNVIPAKAGNLTLGPAEVQMIYRVPMGNSRRGGGDIFDQLLGGRYARRQGTVASEGTAIRVSPLPTNAPASFTGAVGQFNMAVTPGATNVAAGDPITLNIRIEGRGAMDLVQLPNFNWRDFTFYTPISQVTNSNGGAPNSLKIFDQVVVPQRAGIAAIPAIEFSYFDPEQRAYKTIRQGPIAISVRATGAGAAQPTVAAGAVPAEKDRGPASADIVHIKPTFGTIAPAATAASSSAPILILQLLPIGLWAAVVGWRRKQDRLANDPRAQRSLAVERTLSTSLPELRRLAAENQQEQFFAGVFRLLQEVLGERLDVPSSAITEAVVDEKLPRLGASADLMGRLHDLFAMCNQARYAGVSVAGMEAVIPQLESALAEARRLPQGTGGKV